MIKNEVNSLDRIAAAVEALAENQEGEQTIEPSSGTSGGVMFVNHAVDFQTGPTIQKKASELYNALCSGKIVYLIEGEDFPEYGFMITHFAVEGDGFCFGTATGTEYVSDSGDDYPVYRDAQGDGPEPPAGGGGSQSLS